MEALTPGGHSLVFYSHTAARDYSDKKVTALAWNHFMGKESVPDLFTIVAHPSNLKNPWNSLDRFPDGVEVVNFDSFWRRQLDDSLIGFGLTVLTIPLNNFLAGIRFDQIYPKDLSSWDAMNSALPGRFGILAQNSEANFKVTPKLSLPWPTYGQSFRYAANVVYYDPPLASEFETRKKQIYSSLHKGRSAMVFSFIHPFRGNDFSLHCKDKTYHSGDTVLSTSEVCEFHVRTPSNFPYRRILRIWKNTSSSPRENLARTALKYGRKQRRSFRYWRPANRRTFCIIRFILSSVGVRPNPVEVPVIPTAKPS